MLTGRRQRTAAERERQRVELRERLRRTKVGALRSPVRGITGEGGGGLWCWDALRRADVGIREVIEDAAEFDEGVLRSVEEDVKYEGYVQREARQIERLQELEGVGLVEGSRYWEAPGLSREVQEKLKAVRPGTLGQASRIPGVTPAAVALLRVYARQHGVRCGGDATEDARGEGSAERVSGGFT